MDAALRLTLPALSALAIALVLTGRAHAEHRRVVTVEVDDVSLETSGYGKSPETRFNLSEPVPLEGVSVIWVDAVIVRVERDVANPGPDGTSPGADGFTGSARVYDSDGRVVAANPDTRVALSNRAAPAEFVMRYPIGEAFSNPYDFDPGVDPGFTESATSFGVSLQIIPVQTGGGPNPRSRLESTLRYLSRYVFRVAISNARILSLENGRVRFRWKKSGSRRWRTMELDALEFIRRFLEHVLPPGFQKLRHYGFLSPQSSVSLDEVRDLVACAKSTTSAPISDTASEQASASTETVTMIRATCPHCGGRLHVARIIFHRLAFRDSG